MNYRTLNKIAVIGNGCSGKSYFSNKLSLLLKIPVFHLDDFYWDKSGNNLEPSLWQSTHQSLLNKKKWIIEGTQQKLLSNRINEADLIVFLNPCLFTLVSRLLKKHLKKEVVDGFPIKKGLIKNFLWLLKFNYKIKKKVRLLIQKKPHIIISTRKDMQQFFINLKN